MAEAYRSIGRPERALTFYEQVLPIWREVGNRVGEAVTLNNMGLAYEAMGQPERALTLYEQALPIRAEVGSRVGEARTLNNMGLAYEAMGQPERALTLYEQSLSILREVGDRAGEATVLDNMAVVLYKHLNRPKEALTRLEEAIEVLIETGLPQNLAGRTIERLRQVLEGMQRQYPCDVEVLPSDVIEHIITNTIAVMIVAQNHKAEWRDSIARDLEQMQHSGTNWQIEVDFFTAVLDILDGRVPSLPGDHPYAPALAAIQEGIARAGLQEEEAGEEGELAFDAELIQRSIAALVAGPQERMAHAQYLAGMSTSATDAGLKALIQVIQLALFGGDLSQVGENLSGVYKQAWEMIVVGGRVSTSLTCGSFMCTSRRGR